MLITLPLYVLRELGKAIALSLFVFMFVMLAPSAGILIGDGVSLWTVLLSLPYMVPLISPQVLPLAIITAILVCYGRLAGNNEFIAAQAGGIHPFWLGAPALVLALAAVFVTVFLNEFVLGPATGAIKMAALADQSDILKRRLARPGSITLETESGSGQFVAVHRWPADARGRAAIDITEFVPPPAPPTDPADPFGPLWSDDAPRPARHVVARGHRIDDIVRDPRDQLLRLPVEFTRPLVYVYGHGSPVDTETFETGVGTQWLTLGRGGRIRIDDSRSSYWSITRLIRERRKLGEMRDYYVVAAEKAAEAVEIAGPVAAAEAAEMEAAKAHERETYRAFFALCERDTRRYTAQINLQVALAFSCLAFALLGAPMGLSLRRKETSVGFVVGALVALLYFGFLKMFQSLVENGTVGWWGMWLPNGALLVLSLWYWRKLRYVAG